MKRTALSIGDFALTAGDHVLALGTGEQLERLEHLLAPRMPR